MPLHAIIIPNIKLSSDISLYEGAQRRGFKVGSIQQAKRATDTWHIAHRRATNVLEETGMDGGLRSEDTSAERETGTQRW